MDRNQGLFPALCAVFTETILLCSTFTLFGTSRGDGRIEILPLPWLLWALALCLFFYWFIGRGSSVAAIGIAGAVLYATGAFVLLFFFSSPGGPAGWLIGLLFLLLSLWRCIVLHIKPPDERRYLNYVELSVAGTVVFLFLQAGNTRLGTVYDLCLLAAVLLSFLALIRDRIVSEKNATVTLSRLQGVSLLLACAGLLAAFLLSALWLGSSALQRGLGGLIHGAGRLLSAIGGALSAALNWLFSLFPTPEFEPTEMGGTPAPEASGTEWEALPLPPEWVIPGAVLLLALAGLLAALFLLRKLRFGKGAVRRKPSRAAVKKPKKRPSLRARLRFRLLALVRRDTPQGLLVYAERQGARKKMPRKAGETHRDYLLRLGASSEALQTEEARRLLGQLSRALDFHYYGPEETPEAAPCFTQASAPALRRLLRS